MSIANHPAAEHICHDDPPSPTEYCPAKTDNASGRVRRPVELTPAVTYCTSEQMDLLRQIVTEIDRLASRKTPLGPASFATTPDDEALTASCVPGAPRRRCARNRNVRCMDGAERSRSVACG
jgi:hypothetical protein